MVFTFSFLSLLFQDFFFFFVQVFIIFYLYFLFLWFLKLGSLSIVCLNWTFLCTAFACASRTFSDGNMLLQTQHFLCWFVICSTSDPLSENVLLQYWQQYSLSLPFFIWHLLSWVFKLASLLKFLSHKTHLFSISFKLKTGQYKLQVQLTWYMIFLPLRESENVDKEVFSLVEHVTIRLWQCPNLSRFFGKMAALRWNV